MKVVFANQLRGIAAIMVLLSHYFGTYFFQSHYISSVLGVEPESRNYLDIGLVRILSEHYAGINLGPLGVSVFFLISGFVVMFSLGKLTSAGFIIQRAFRIYPAYWVSLLICFGFASVSAWFFGRESGYVTYGARNIVANVFLYQDAVGAASINFVNWTLTIELIFYAMFSIVFLLGVNDKKVNHILISFMLACMLILFIKRCNHGEYSQILMFFLSRVKYLSFMCIGYCFFLKMKGLIHLTSLLYLILIYLAISLGFLCLEGNDEQVSVLGYNYLYGLIIFSASYMYRYKFKNNKFLDFFSDISYPLYLIHATCGYVLISILSYKGLGIYTSSIISLIVVATISYLMHITIERYSNNFGKAISKSMPRKIKR